MKKFLINTLCYLILFNSFIAIFSDSVYAKETLIKEIKKQYTIKKENFKKTIKELKDSGIFNNKCTIGITVGVATIAVIGIGMRIFKLYNNINSLTTEKISAKADNKVNNNSLKDSIEEEEYGEYGEYGE